MITQRERWVIMAVQVFLGSVGHDPTRVTTTNENSG
jgi:hypothetical protein